MKGLGAKASSWFRFWIAATLVCACGKEAERIAPERTNELERSAETSGGSRAKIAPAALLEAEPFDSTSLGGLHGTILFQGEAPERFDQGVSARSECQHHSGVDQRANAVVVNAGKLAGAFVTLSSGYDKTAIPAFSGDAAILDQKGCMYVPRVLGVRVGQTIRVTNLDPASHNVHTKGKRNREANTTMGAKQTPLELVFERPELPIPFKCDIHPWMGAAVFVEEHPWFAVSDEAGAFRIRDVPPGEYVVQAIHEGLGKVSGSVKVAAGSSTGFTLSFSK